MVGEADLEAGSARAEPIPPRTIVRVRSAFHSVQLRAFTQGANPDRRKPIPSHPSRFFGRDPRERSPLHPRIATPLKIAYSLAQLFRRPSMRKFLLVLLLLLSVFYVASSRYSLQSGHSIDGDYRLLLVDKGSGQVKFLIGK